MPTERIPAMGESTIKRFWLLGMAHWVVATLPLLAPLWSLDIRQLPFVIFLLTVPALATLMLLAFWVGMGGGYLAIRLAAAVLGAWYIGLSTQVGVELLADPRPTYWEAVRDSLTASPVEIAAVVLASGGFLVFRRFAELRCVDSYGEPAAGEWRRYSLAEILVLISVAAVALAAIRLSRERIPLHSSAVNATLVMLLSYAAFFVNAIYVARATLGSPPVLPKVSVALVIAFLLGVTVGIVARDDQLALWLVPANGVTFVVGTAVLAASLGVVRSAGYRLVSTKGPPPTEQVSPFD